MRTFIPLLLLLILVAALLREDAVLTVFYMLVAVYLVALWWSRNAFKHLTFTRKFLPRAFYGQEVPVQIEIRNTAWLPVIWLKVHESLPVDLASPNFVRGIVSLNPRGRARIEYHVTGRKRGYYKIGPLFLDSGDMLGMAGDSKHIASEDSLIVFPRIIPLPRLSLPSNSPFGSLRERRPLFEDPTRVRGKRDYVAGDSLRRVDWKSTAAVGRLQVRCYEPSIAVETCIALNLNPGDYDPQFSVNSSETAVTAAASIASWASQKKQAVGLFTNGLDPLADECCAPRPLPPKRSSAALMQVLEVLARVQPGDYMSCAELLRRSSGDLSWGTTLVLVTSLISDRLLDELFQAQKRGLNIVIVAVGPVRHQSELHRRAKHFGIQVYSFEHEQDLEVWVTPQ